MDDVTRILSEIEQGDTHAAEQLLPLVYNELRRLAAAKMAQERPGQTLQPTALVHEAYLRLVDVDKARTWDSRGHFFGAAAEAMRRILVDSARKKSTAKRGDGLVRKDLSDHDIAAPVDTEELLELNDALTQLEKVDSLAAELVKLRYFGGLSSDEAASALNISSRSAYYTWAYAKSWLRRELRSEQK